MPRRTILRLAAVLFALATSGTLAQPSTDLSWRWRSGDAARYTVHETMTQQVSGMASDTLRWERTIEYSERVLSVDRESGEATVERRIDRVAVKLAGDLLPEVEHDTADPGAHPEAAASPFIAPFVRMAGATVTFRVSPDGSVGSAEDAAGLWTAALDPLRGTPLAGALTPPDADALRRQIEAGLRILPNERVRRGRPWTQRIPNATPLGTVTADLSHTLTGVQRRRGRGLPEIKTSGTLRADPEAQPGGLLGLTGVRVRLVDASAEGAALYDPEAGRLASQSLTITTRWRSEPTETDLADLLGDSEQTIVQSAECVMTEFTRGTGTPAEPPSDAP